LGSLVARQGIGSLAFGGLDSLLGEPVVAVIAATPEVCGRDLFANWNQCADGRTRQRVRRGHIGSSLRPTAGV
jgi:hypothetical protein